MFSRLERRFCWAFFLLVELGTTHTLPALAQTEKPPERKAGRAAKAPSYQGRTAEQWFEALNSPNRSTQREAAEALTEMSSGAVPFLLEALEDENADVRCRAARCLGRIGPRAEAAAARLCECMDDRMVRSAAVVALGNIGRRAKAAIPTLAKALKDKSDFVRRAACDALGDIGSAAVPALIAAIEDGDESSNAVIVLYRIGPDARAAVPVLIRKLQQRPDREGAPWNVIAALGAIGPDARAAIPIIRPFLASELGRSFDTCRINAAVALHQIAPETREGVGALTGWLVVKDKELAKHALRELRDLGPGAEAALPVLIDILSDHEREESLRFLAMETIGAIGPKAKRAAPAIVEALSASDKTRIDMGPEVAKALGHIGPNAKIGLTQLEIAAKDDDPNTQIWAHYALWRIDRRQTSLDTLTALVQEKEKTPEPIREAAANALGYIGSDAKRAVAPLIEMLKGGEFRLRWAATESLGRIGPEAKSALPLLIEQADSGNRLLRDAAREAIKKIDPNALSKAGLE